jgi:protein-tyrosine phosphatase
VADGTSTVVATPHIHPGFAVDPKEVAPRVKQLSEHLFHAGVPLKVHAGGELSHLMVGRLTQSQLDAIAHGPSGRRWLLLEAPFDGLDRDFVTAANELRAHGFAVVVAHPERVSMGWRTRRALAHEVAAGSVLQLTAGSFIGGFGDAVEAEALRLLRWAPRVVIASDAHGAIRMPVLRPTLRTLDAAQVSDPSRFISSEPQVLLAQGLVSRRTHAAA